MSILQPRWQGCGQVGELSLDLSQPLADWSIEQGPEIQIICESGTAREPLPPGTWPQERSRLLLGGTDLASQTRKVGKSRTQTLS